MGDPATYKRYAEECERLAKFMPEEHRPTLLKIAEAWMKLSTNAATARANAKGTDEGS